MSEPKIDPAFQAPEQPEIPDTDEDMDEPPVDEDIDELEQEPIYDNWGSLVSDKQQDINQTLNSVFSKQAEIALNLNKVREDALNSLVKSKSKKFKDGSKSLEPEGVRDTEEYIKSIGMKVLRDNDPDFAEIVDEARAIDKNFNPNRAKQLEEAKNRIIEKMRAYEGKRNYKGWNKMIESISNDLKKFGYIYDTDDLSTPNEIDKLTQHPFPYQFKSITNLDNIDVDELEKYLTYRVNVAKRLSDKVKAHKTDLQQQMNEYKDNTSFVTNRKVAIDNRDEFYEIAKPTLETYKELISNYSQYLTPEVISDLEKNVQQINDYISDARLKGVSAGKLAEYTRLVNTVRKNVRDNYQNILNKMQAYSNSVSAEDAILNEIKSLASYEQYSQLPPAIFEKLPDEIKNKVMRLMELKAKLQKQQGKTKTISKKYKLNADNHPLSQDSKPKLFNPRLFEPWVKPLLNKGYSIHNKIAQHSAYNASFQ